MQFLRPQFAAVTILLPLLFLFSSESFAAAADTALIVRPRDVQGNPLQGEAVLYPVDSESATIPVRKVSDGEVITFNKSDLPRRVGSRVIHGLYEYIVGAKGYAPVTGKVDLPTSTVEHFATLSPARQREIRIFTRSAAPAPETIRPVLCYENQIRLAWKAIGAAATRPTTATELSILPLEAVERGIYRFWIPEDAPPFYLLFDAPGFLRSYVSDRMTTADFRNGYREIILPPPGAIEASYRKEKFADVFRITGRLYRQERLSPDEVIMVPLGTVQSSSTEVLQIRNLFPGKYVIVGLRGESFQRVTISEHETVRLNLDSPRKTADKTDEAIVPPAITASGALPAPVPAPNPTPTPLRAAPVLTPTPTPLPIGNEQQRRQAEEIRLNQERYIKSTLETTSSAASTPPTTGTEGLTREERIRLHKARIDRIREENAKRRNEELSASVERKLQQLTATLSRKPESTTTSSHERRSEPGENERLRFYITVFERLLGDRSLRTDPILLSTHLMQVAREFQQEATDTTISQLLESVDERKLTREQRIKAHQERIERIIESNRLRQELAAIEARAAARGSTTTLTIDSLSTNTTTTVSQQMQGLTDEDLLRIKILVDSALMRNRISRNENTLSQLKLKTALAMENEKATSTLTRALTQGYQDPVPGPEKQEELIKSGKQTTDSVSLVLSDAPISQGLRVLSDKTGLQFRAMGKVADLRTTITIGQDSPGQVMNRIIRENYGLIWHQPDHRIPSYELWDRETLLQQP